MRCYVISGADIGDSRLLVLGCVNKTQCIRCDGDFLADMVMHCVVVMFFVNIHVNRLKFVG